MKLIKQKKKFLKTLFISILAITNYENVKADPMNISPPYDLYLYSLSANGETRDGIPRFPNISNMYGINVYARHLGLEFDKNLSSVDASLIQTKTGVTGGILYGSSQANITSAVPTFISYNSNELGFYIDTEDLSEISYFPLSENYCKKVGLGGPQMILEQNLIDKHIFPWSTDNKKFVLNVDFQLPTAEYKSRTKKGTFEVKNNMNSDDHAPVFQSSFFVYLQDTVSYKNIAVLFNLYNPRGPYSSAIGNDSYTLFYTSSITGDNSNDKLVNAEFSNEGSEFIKKPFSGYKNFKVSISNNQMQKILGRFAPRMGFTQDLSKVKVIFIGLLNELTPISQSSQCISDFVPQTYSKVGMSFKNFSHAVEAITPPNAASGI